MQLGVKEMWLYTHGIFNIKFKYPFPEWHWHQYHEDVIKWKHFPRYWPFMRGIHRSPVNSAHKGQWRGALMFSLICACMDGWVNNREAGDFRRHRAHYDVPVMILLMIVQCTWNVTCYLPIKRVFSFKVDGKCCKTCLVGLLIRSIFPAKNRTN